LLWGGISAFIGVFELLLGIGLFLLGERLLLTGERHVHAVDIKEAYQVRILLVAKILSIGSNTRKELCACYELLCGRVGEGLDGYLDGLEGVVVAAVVVSELLILANEVVHHVPTSP